MPKTIHKYTLDPTEDPCTVSMPSGAKVLSVGVQSEHIRVWAEVDPSEGCSLRQFSIVGTGHAVKTTGRFIGTVMLYGGSLVLHVYEKGGGDAQ